MRLPTPWHRFENDDSHPVVFAGVGNPTMGWLKVTLRPLTGEAGNWQPINTATVPHSLPPAVVPTLIDASPGHVIAHTLLATPTVTVAPVALKVTELLPPLAAGPTPFTTRKQLSHDR
jgi:hypothetical protein